MRLLLLALLPFAVNAADLRAVAMLGAYHAEPTYWCGNTQRDYQRLTPGLGLSADWKDASITAGVWRNSHEHWSPFVIADYRPIRFYDVSLGVFGGASMGYCNHGEYKTLPLGGFSLRADVGTTALHFLVIPHISSRGSEVPTTVGVAVSWKV